jgi:predicted acylesterase/phospholipase RssA
MLVGSVHNQRASLTPDAVDLMINLDLRGVSLLDFKRVAEVAALGYDASVATVADWARASGWSAAA